MVVIEKKTILHNNHSTPSLCFLTSFCSKAGLFLEIVCKFDSLIAGAQKKQ